jgi:CheY-like chemotaxis protein
LKKGAPAILVVDDEPFVTEVLSRWLASEGYECERASSGREALETLARREFGLVISDICLASDVCPPVAGLARTRETILMPGPNFGEHHRVQVVQVPRPDRVLKALGSP